MSQAATKKTPSRPIRNAATTKPIAADPDDDRYGPGSAGLKMTPEEFDDLPASEFVRGNRYEVINGVFVASPFPGPGERSLNDYLGYMLTQFFETPSKQPIDADTLPEQTIATTNRRRADRAIWVGLGRKPNEQTDVPAIDRKSVV